MHETFCGVNSSEFSGETIMTTKKKPTRKKTFWQTYGRKIKVTILVAFCSALGLWIFSSVRDGAKSLALSIDERYNNQALANELRPEINKKLIDMEKKMEHNDDLIAQQSVKTFEMFQGKLEVESLEDLRCQKTLVMKELERDPKNLYLQDRLKYLERKIEILERKHLLK